MANLKRTLTSTAIIAGTYALLTGLTYYICSPSLCFLESTATFIGHPLTTLPNEPGALVRTMSLWIQQWFVTPLTASLICGALLTVITLSLGSILWTVSGCLALMPLALMPSIFLIQVHTDMDYRLSSTVAVAITTVGLIPVAEVRNAGLRIVMSIAGCIILYLAAGQATVLYAVSAALISTATDGKKSLFSWIYVLAALGMTYLGYMAGAWSSPGMAMLPWGYYPHWHHPIAEDLLPWGAVTAVILTAAIVKSALSAKAKKSAKSWFIPAMAAIITTIFARGDNPFATLWLLSSNQQWDEVEAAYKDVDKEDATMQNFLNLALAEKGTLCDYLFWHPNNGVAALHNTEQKSPYTYMLLSDVYYSMGFIALAKRYAFEANQALGNASPRMLMRLADTNIVTGDYAVATKYLDILSLTSQYSGWADQRRGMLTDVAVASHPVLGAKRGCIFPDNRFAGSKGIADDMLQVLRANPAHASTMQYIGAYYMLSRNIPALISLVDEFYGSPALGEPLPVHFQEAMVVDGLINGNGIDARYNIHPSVLERCKAFWAEHKPQPNTLWHYLRQK